MDNELKCKMQLYQILEKTEENLQDERLGEKLLDLTPEA